MKKKSRFKLGYVCPLHGLVKFPALGKPLVCVEVLSTGKVCNLPLRIKFTKID